MTIKVISQSTSERRKETKELFEKVKPLLDKGLNYRNAVAEVTNYHSYTSLSRYAWYKELVEYGKTQGYSLQDYQFNKKKNE